MLLIVIEMFLNVARRQCMEGCFDFDPCVFVLQLQLSLLDDQQKYRNIAGTG